MVVETVGCGGEDSRAELPRFKSISHCSDSRQVIAHSVSVAPSVK